MNLTQALATLRAYDQISPAWTEDDMRQMWNESEEIRTCASIILTGSIAGDMIPRADAELAVALMVEKAADIIGMCDQVGADAEGPVRALALAPALAELQALQRDRDCMKANADDAYEKWIAERSRAEAVEAANEQLLVMATEEQSARKAAEEKLVEWQASQHYAYIGRDGKTVLARELEERAEASEAELATLRAQVDRLKATFRVNMLRYGPTGTSHEEIDAAISAALTEGAAL